MRLVYVEWEDAVLAGGGWTKIEDAKAFDPAPCKSVGWAVIEDDKAIVLAGTVGDDTDCGAIVVIPMPWVTRIVELKAPKNG